MKGRNKNNRWMDEGIKEIKNKLHDAEKKYEWNTRKGEKEEIERGRT
jgi:hypothetical protein